MRWVFMDGGDAVSCRMYHGLPSAFRGLSRSLFPAFGCRILLFAFIWAWLGVVFLEPPLVLVAGAAGRVTSGSALLLAGVEVALSLLIWWLVVRRLKYRPLTALLYPLILAVGVAAAFTSLAVHLVGVSRWKERTLPRPRLRLP